MNFILEEIKTSRMLYTFRTEVYILLTYNLSRFYILFT